MASLAGQTLQSTYTSLLKLNGNTDSTVAGGGNAIQVKTGDDDATPLYLNTDRVGIGGNSPTATLSVFGDATISGDLTVSGNDITFGDGSTIKANNGYLLIEDTTDANDYFMILDSTSANYDSSLAFAEAGSIKWSIGNDGNDSDSFKMSTNTSATLETDTKLTLTSGGNLTLAGGITTSGTTIHTRTSVTNLTNDGSIPITATCVNIDANGVARTGIRFAGAGVAGQMIIVNNTGGETLTFHDTPGTCLVRGMTTSLDTMESLGVYMFVSDGSLWNLIGGGSLPNEGLTAS